MQIQQLLQIASDMISGEGASAVARKKAVTRFFAVFYFLVSLESSSKDASDEVCHVFVNKFKIEI